MAGESDNFRHPKKRAMLKALAKSGNITAAANAAKIDRTSHYVWLKEDIEYVAAVEDAMEQAGDLLEEEARRRAYTGVLKPVYQGGEKVGSVREFSDTLMIFLLKGARPEKYKERVDMNHRGSVAMRHRVDLSNLSNDELDSLDRIAERVSLPPDSGAGSD